jgi:hypothetical protein
MGKSGSELGADLALIYQTGAQLLPHLADQFQSAKSTITAIGDDSGGAWGRDASLGIGATGCLPNFNAYVDAIAAHLTSTATNLDDTGAALCYASTDYAASDDGAKAEFDRLKNTDVLDG